MADDLSPAQIQALVSRHDAQRASANLAGVSDVQPEAAASAVKTGPAIGLTPEAGMRDPTSVQDAAAIQEQQAVLARSSAVQRWARDAPPAHLATSQDDFPSLEKISGAVNSYLAAPWEELWSGVTAQYNSDLARMRAPLKPTDIVTTPLQGIESLSNYGQLALQGLTNAALGPFAGVPSLEQKGIRQVLGPQGAAIFNEALSKGLLALAPGFKGPDVELGARVLPEGIAPEDIQTNAKRLTGPPQEPAPPPPEAKAEYAPSPYTSVAGTPPPGFSAETDFVHTEVANADAEAVGNIQEALAGSKILERSPEVTKAFLEQEIPPEANAYIDTQAFNKLFLDGKITFDDYLALFSTESHQFALVDAYEAGGEVAIPLADYLAATAGKPWAEALNQSTRFSENGVSQAQAKELNVPEPFDFNAEIAHDPTLPDSANAALKELAPSLAAATQQAGKEVYLKALFDQGKALGMTDKMLEQWSEKVKTAQQAIYDKTVKLAARKLQFYRSQKYKAAYQRHYPDVVQELLARRDVKAYHQLRYGTNEEAPKDLVTGNALVENGKPITFYHGSGHVDIENWEVPKHSAHKVMSFSYSPKFASDWALGKGGAPGKYPVVYTVHLFAKNPADFRNSEDVEKAVNAYKKYRPQELYESDADFEHRVAYQRQAYAHASWSHWEQPALWANVNPPWDAAHMKESWTDPSLNISIANGDQVHFKYRPETVPVKVRLAEADRKNFPQALRDRLPRGIWDKDGAPAEDFASELGFDSAEQMLNEIAALREEHGKLSLKNWLLREFKLEAARRAEVEHGFSLDPQAILEEARAGVVVPQVEDLLIGNLQAAAGQLNAAGVPIPPFNAADIKADALQSFANLPVKDAINVKQHINNYRANMKVVEKGLLGGKPEELIAGFRARQRALINFYKLQEALKFKRSYEGAVANWQSLARKKTTPKIDQDFLNQIHIVLGNMGLKLARQGPELADSLRGVTLSQFLQNLAATGAAPVQAPMPTKTPLEMKVEDFRGVREMIKSLKALGEEAQAVYAAGQRAHLDAVGKEVVANADFLGRRTTLEGLRKSRTGIAKTIETFGSKLPRVIGAYNLRPETYFFYLDRDKFGPLMRYVVDPLVKGKFNEADLHKAIRNELQAFYKAHPGLEASMEKPIVVPELQWRGINWLRTRGDAVVTALNLGTKENLKALSEGFQWEPATIHAALEHVLRPEDWDLVQKIWDLHEQTLWPKIVETYRDKAVSGVPPRKKVNRNFSVGDRQMRGGYFQIEFDRNELKRLGANDPTLQSAASLWGAETGNSPANNYTKEVTGFSAPLDLNFSSVPNRFEQIIHDISYRKALIQAQKVLSQPDVVAAVQEVLGPEYVGLNEQWLQYIAREAVFNGSGSDSWARGIRGIRNNFTTALTIYRISTMMVHFPIAGMHMLAETGIVPTFSAAADIYGRALVDLVKTPGQASYWRNFIQQNSGELRNLEIATDRDVRDAIIALQDKHGPIDNFKQAGFAFWTFLKRQEAQITWLARYRIEMSRSMDHELAVSAADKSVRDTQGAGGSMDLPILFRGGQNAVGEFGKMSGTLLMGFRNATFNRGWRFGMGLRRVLEGKGSGDDWGMVGWALGFFILPALWVQQVRDHYNRQSMSLPEALLENTVGTLPLMDSIIHLTFHGGDTFQTPPEEIAGSFVDTAKILAGQPVTQPVRHVLDAISFMTGGFPGDQAAIASQTLWDIEQGNLRPADPADLLHDLAAGEPRSRGGGHHIGKVKTKP